MNSGNLKTALMEVYNVKPTTAEKMMEMLEIMAYCLECKYLDGVADGYRGKYQDELVTKRDVEIALLNKGQASKRYELGETWELNYEEIIEALSKM